MDSSTVNRISRRDFLKTSICGFVGFSAAKLVPGPAMAKTPKSSGFDPADIMIEPNAVIKVLRWSEFVSSEKKIWLANTRRWEKLTGARVHTDFVPWSDVRSNAALEATIGAGHDIAFGLHDDPHLYPHKLVDLTDLAEYLGGKYGGWYPVFETYGRGVRTNRWIALPLGQSGSCINYRKSSVQEAGFESIPKDIEGFLKCCKALRAKGHYTGFSLGHAVGDANTWTHWWLWSFGGKAIDADGQTVAINSRETLQALDAARALYETMIPGVENWLDPDNNRAFLNGDITMALNGSSIVYAAKHYHPEIYADLAASNMPIGQVGYPTELSTTSTGYIFKHTAVPNAARHYLTFMFEAEQYGNWIANGYGYISHSLKYYYDLAAWKQDPRITPYRECASRALPNGYPGPLGTTSAAAMSEFIIVDMFADVCTHGRSPKTAALAAEKRLARLYRQA